MSRVVILGWKIFSQRLEIRLGISERQGLGEINNPFFLEAY